MNSATNLTSVIRRLRATAAGRPTDAELLAGYTRQGDERAFATLVQRYGGLVLGVARRQLADHQQAEDVFQATFLALARSANRLDSKTPLANWLYTVALRQARKLRDRLCSRSIIVTGWSDCGTSRPVRYSGSFPRSVKTRKRTITPSGTPCYRRTAKHWQSPTSPPDEGSSRRSWFDFGMSRREKKGMNLSATTTMSAWRSRAVEVLACIGTTEAKELLAGSAKGEASARFTTAADAALKTMKVRDAGR
jgi:RNA polymerase sigma factor (sigma-70 family)